jgi:glutamate/tyrosine decarboxylase-like PLP-dependent enzyme
MYGHRPSRKVVGPRRPWVRDASTLTRAYGLSAEYLVETRLGDQPLNYYDRGPQLTRGFRALKLWLSLNTFQLAAFRLEVERGIELAEYTQAALERHTGWEVVTPAQLGIVTFRPLRPNLTRSQLDAPTRAIAVATLDDGLCMLITTEVAGRRHPRSRRWCPPGSSSRPWPAGP